MVGEEDEEQACSSESFDVGSGKHQWNWKLGWVSISAIFSFRKQCAKLSSDEVLYNAKLHPEQYSDTFSSDQIKQLHKSIRYVCQTAVDNLGDSSKFPDEWLFNHRWGKGKKDASKTLPNGEKIIHLTVGGRTSCVVPSVQKKTGAVAGDIKKEDLNGDDGMDEKQASKLKANASKKRKAVVEEEDGIVEPNKEEPAENGAKGKAKKAKSTPKSGKVKAEEAPSDGRRRSGRASKTK